MLRSPYFSRQSRVALVLALPLLWASFDDEMEAYMPSNIRSNIRSAYDVIRTLPPEIAPVTKVLMVVSGHEAMLHIDPIPDFGQLDGSVSAINCSDVNNLATSSQTHATLQEIFSQVVQLRQEVQGQFTNLGTRVQHLENRLENKVDVVNRNVQRIALQPAQRRPAEQATAVFPAVGEVMNALNNTGAGEGHIDARATLCERPNNLHVLWQEYQHGVGNRKPAKDFTRAEKGKCRKSYYRRNLVWTKIDSLVRAGHLCNAACDILQAEYGQTSSVTKIIDKIIQEQPRSSKVARRQIIRGRNARVQLN
jgi:hypothetical protein